MEALFLSRPARSAAARFLGLIALLSLAVLLPAASLPAAEEGKALATPHTEPGVSLLKARWRVFGAHPLELYYYYPAPHALASLEAHASEMTALAPQCFWVDDHGVVRGEIPPQVMAMARRTGLPLMPLLINPGFNRATASALLRSADAQERAAAYLAYLAKRDGYVGWQLDLEYLDPADKCRYTRFVERVAARLHQDKRLISVAVVPRFSDTYPEIADAGEFHTGEWGAPYDYRALGRVADFLILMAYDHHADNTPPGPIAGYDWVKAALDYAVSRVPRAKLLLGIPFYGREWVATVQATTSRTLGFQDAKDALAQLNVEPGWDEHWRAAWFQYRDASGLHTAWYEDKKSLGEKLQLMREYRLRGFAAWRLGIEDPGFWTLAAAARKSRPTPTTTRRRPSPGRAAPARTGSRSR